MSVVAPLSMNRELIFGLLNRARRYHCPVTTTWKFDVEALHVARQMIRVNERKLSLTACLVKATSLVLARHPRFNQHLFHGLLGKYVVTFDSICCTLIVMRRSPTGERVLLPLLIEGSDRLEVTTIQRIIDEHKYGKSDELPQFRAMKRLQKLPRLALSWFGYKARSDHRFFRRHFGTYGLSQMAMGSFGPESGHVVANTAAAFVQGPVRARSKIRDGVSVTRRRLRITLVVDHYLLDGVDILEGMRTLRSVLGNPAELGLIVDEKSLPGTTRTGRA